MSAVRHSWTRRLAASLALGLALFAGSVWASPLRQCTMTVGGYSGSTTLANFPLLVRISPSIISGFGYSQCAAGGADISFALEDGTVLPHEVDTWDTDGESLVWVKVPSISGTETKFKFRWNDPVPAANDATAVWSEYVGVWHLGEADAATETNAVDSTGHGFTATIPNKSETELCATKAAKIGSGRWKPKTTMTVPSYDSQNAGGTFTASGWFYMDERTAYESFFNRKEAWNTGTGWQSNMQLDNQKFFCSGSGNKDQVKSFSTSVVGRWINYAIVFNGTSMQPYDNGTAVSGGAVTINAAGDNNRPLYVGGSIKGTIDEIRIRKAASSADWVKAEYEQVTKANYVTAGDVEILETKAIMIRSSLGLEYGTVSPAYGSIAEPVAGQEYVFTCTQTEEILDENRTKAVCTGWKLKKLADGSLVKSSSDEGESAFECRHTYAEGVGVDLEWQWVIRHRVLATAGAGGSVDKPDQWVDAGTDTTITATADEGSQFLNWTGDVFSYAQANSFTVSEPKSLRANFGPADWKLMYVSKSGNDSGSGASTAPLLTIEAAIEKAPSDGTGATILVGPGTYTATNKTVQADSVIYAIYLNKANVQIVSTDGPAVTKINAGTDTARAEAKICASGASMSGFSFINGCHNGKTRYPGVNVTAGSVSNCWFSIRGMWASSFGLLNLASGTRADDIMLTPTTYSGGEVSPLICASGATIDGLVVTNVTYTGTPKNYVVLYGSSTLRNALFADNQMGNVDTTSLTSLVGSDGTACLVSDCTFANNRITANNGAIAVGAKMTVTNCIFWGNSSLSANADFNGGSNKARVFTSCSDELTAGENNNIIVNPQFVDFDNHDYRLRAVSKAKEMGAPWLRPSGAATELECAADGDVYTSEAGKSLEVTFTGYAAGATGNVTAVWDFGDGATSTDWPVAKHTYTKPGQYVATVTVTDESGNPSVTYTIETAVTIIPDTCYVKQDSVGVFPYDTWEKATSNLIDAVNVGSRHIIVTNGTYTTPTPQIAISRPLSIVSVEGPSKTTIKTASSAAIHRRIFTLTGSDDILVSGFTLLGGNTSSAYYWTATIEMSAGVLTNCVIREKGTISRSKACYFTGTAKAVDCIFDGREMKTSNDSSEQCGIQLNGSSVVMDRCEIFGYKAPTGNSDGYLGESPVSIRNGATLRNSLVHHCTNGTATAAQYRGVVTLLTSGKIENCTIVNNRAGGYGGGVYAVKGTIVNSIVYGNTAAMDGDDLYSTSTTPTVDYTCAGDFSSWQAGAGTGCTVKSPNFEGAATNNWRLTALSTGCLDTGNNDSVTGDLDLDRGARIVNDAVDMGCYEFAGSTDVPLDGTIDADVSSGRIPLTVVYEANIVGNEDGLKLTWDFGDGSAKVVGGKCITNTFTTCGSFTVKVTAENSKPETKVITIANPIIAVPQTCYVATDGGNESPYDTWAKAARSITAAIALNPRRVVVSNGTYAVSGDGVVISTDLELVSVNGPDVTKISAATCRNVWLSHTNAVCSGFSLINGYGNWESTDIAATVTAGVLTNCVIPSVYGGQYRAPVVRVKSKGKVTNCTINLTGMGGNDNGSNYFCSTLVEGGMIENTEICNYKQTGGETMSTPRAALTLTGAAVARNILVRNTTSTPSTPNNQAMAAVVITGSGTLENCTIVNSKGSYGGAGITITSSAKDTPIVRNCIVVNSTSSNGAANPDIRDANSPSAPRVTYSCSADLTSGEGNIANTNGLFTVRRNRPKYSLAPTSPARDAGANLDWMTDGATDLIGNPRVFGTRPDMGCYESQAKGLLLLVR